ncbi:DUF5615 family PIN-like protein [soil metagenome]
MLLLDQNLSYRMLANLAPYYQGATHVSLIKMLDADDLAIWRFARDHNLAILTKDADFYEFSLLYQHPPKIIWLKSGNSATKFIVDKLIDKQDAIKAFLDNQAVACLELY